MAINNSQEELKGEWDNACTYKGAFGEDGVICLPEGYTITQRFSKKYYIENGNLWVQSVSNKTELEVDGVLYKVPRFSVQSQVTLENSEIHYIVRNKQACQKVVKHSNKLYEYGSFTVNRTNTIVKCPKEEDSPKLSCDAVNKVMHYTCILVRKDSNTSHAPITLMYARVYITIYSIIAMIIIYLL